MPVKGGYLVREGVWNYASGIDISTHFFAGISVHHETPDGPRLEPRLAVIDRKDYEIVDNWHVVGMRGTGSRQVIARDLFIPEFRTIVPPRDAFNARNAPGRRVHSNSMYAAGRLTSVLFGENAAVAVGVAKGALDVYEDDLQVRTTRFPPFTRLAETVQSQRYYGEAVALIEMAEATVLRAGADYMECARRDVEENILFSDERDQRLQLLEHYAGKAAGDAVEMIFRTSGTHSAQEGSLLQRYFRDMSVMKTHAGAQWDRAAEAYGRVHLTGSSPAAERFAAESGPR